MIDLKPHRKWIGLLALAALIGAGNRPVVGLALEKARTRHRALQAANEKAVADLRQLRTDIAEAKKMKTQIDTSTAKRFLAPVDRLRAAQIVEHRAAEMRLTRLSYTFLPEEKVFFETVGAGKQEMALSKWTVEADAPTDVSAYAFLNAMEKTMPGRIALKKLSLRRIGRSDSPITNANVRFSANGEWLSNGANENPAEDRP
ncbi:MAG: hypothetical protein PHE27_07230 [Alphaproteobacteria bacterium]|nr:hypothetical protein [Alphaproteobacteria bacterium]